MYQQNNTRMGQFHETTYQLCLEIPFKQAIDFVVEAIRKTQWADPGYKQIARTVFQKIDYKQGHIRIRKKDLQGKPLQNKFLADEQITIRVEPQSEYCYKIWIRSESLVSLPLGHNYDNVVAIKKAIIAKKQTVKKPAKTVNSIPQKASPNNFSHQQSSLDPYQILGIAKGANAKEITEAYLKAIRSNHPDKLAGMAPELLQMAEERTKAINAAYEQLKRFKR